jgi:DNA-directed RNA polymerase beta' subunit
MSYDGLANLSLFKIQSGPFGNTRDFMEMNLHMPQDAESQSELRNLAAVPYQIISPANNAPIIGIFQDSMLGSFRFSREGVEFDKKDAMNLLMMFNKVNTDELVNKQKITSFDVLSQITPPLTMKVKNKLFKDDKDDKKTSNNIMEIINGQYIRGQMDKGILGSGTKGLLQRVCNDFGNMACADYIDNLQNIVTEYLKTSGFSVGVSDLIITKDAREKIVKTITDKKNEVRQLIDQVQFGVFENNTGRSNQEEFESQVTNLLNQGASEAGKAGIAGLNSGNRFIDMAVAGSKGSELNLSQMVACVAQQNVDNKRIGYGFEHRTLPHYTKFDDSLEARGFVENSYIDGLTPQELFFHAMGGRVGLIDTAVKTSTTGYIQRRLIKALEDLMVNYDMTVRNNKNKIIQFSYGEDSIDTVKVENQDLPIVNKSIQDIYSHFNIPEDDKLSQRGLSSIFTKTALSANRASMEDFNAKAKFYTDYMIEMRDSIMKNIFKYKDDSVVRCPVAFTYIINNVAGQQNLNPNSLVDFSLAEAFEMIETTYSMLEVNEYSKPTELFKVLYFYYLTPRDLLINRRFNKAALRILLDTITLNYKRAVVSPGEMVGMIAAQSIGEPTTQMSCPYSEHIRCVKINKNTKKVSMVLTTIGKMCDDIIESYPQFTFNTGHVNSVETLLDALEDEYYIVGVDGQEKTYWNKISHVSKHPVNGNLMKVTTKSGRTVTTTTSHSHLIRQNQTVEPIVGAKLTTGMRIPVAKQIDNTFVVSTINIGNTTYELDNLFGWFIGAYLSEGNLVGNQINITNMSDFYINNVKQIAIRFGTEAVVRRYKGEYGPSVSTRFNHKELANLILNTCNTGSFVKGVPDFAFTAPNEFKAGLIQGYMDGDGNFQSDINHHQIRACSRSERLIKDLSLIFNYFGIFTSLKTQNVKGMPMYNMTISSKYAEIYQTHIGSLVHSDKLMNLVAYVNRIDAHDLSEEIDKINGLGDIIATCGKTLKLEGHSRLYGRWKKKDSIGRRTLQKYIGVFETHENSSLIEKELQILKQAANSDVIWDEIIDIELSTPDQSEFVYDFTVPSNQTFMNDSGVIVHNTLNTFHFAGVASKSNVTRGVPRIEEILSLSENLKNPSLTIYLNEQDELDKDNAQKIMYMIEHTKLVEVVKSCSICFDPDDNNTLIEEDKTLMAQYKEFSDLFDNCTDDAFKTNTKELSKWILRLEMDPEIMLEKNITMDDVHFAIVNAYGVEIHCVYSDYNADNLIFRIRLDQYINQKKGTFEKGGLKPGSAESSSLDQTDQIYKLKALQDNLLNHTVLRGVKHINKVTLRKTKDTMVEKGGSYKKQEAWVLDTIGTNLLDVLGLDYINSKKTFSNDIIEIYNVLGIEAARQAIYNEFIDVIEFDGGYINSHHMTMLCDRMTFAKKLISIYRHGVNNDNIGPIAKASFEETFEMFLKAARHGELDTLRGVSANVMCGQEGYYGTSCFQVVLDLDEMKKLEATIKHEVTDVNDVINRAFLEEIESKDNPCSRDNIKIENNVVNLIVKNTGKLDDDYNPFA